MVLTVLEQFRQPDGASGQNMGNQRVNTIDSLELERSFVSLGPTTFNRLGCTYLDRLQLRNCPQTVNGIDGE